MTTNFKTIEPLVILNCFDKSLTVLILTACEGEYGLTAIKYVACAMETNNVITKMVLVQMDVKMDIKGANAKLVIKK